MPTDSKPTNDTIVELLERVLAEIETLKDGQREIADDIRKLASTTGR